MFKIKYKTDGQVERFKARLVSKGFNEQEGIDYSQTFSPVAKMVAVRYALAVGASSHWPIFQMYVYNAFLQGDLQEEVYMQIPSSFHKGFVHKVCRLKKSLYELKQASRQWNLKLTATLLDLRFIQSHFDYSLFTLNIVTIVTIVLVHVDDPLVTGSNVALIQSTRTKLQKKFWMKDLGALKFFLGIEFSRSSSGILLNQRNYALEIIANSGQGGAKPVYTPLDFNQRLIL